MNEMVIGIFELMRNQVTAHLLILIIRIPIEPIGNQGSTQKILSFWKWSISSSFVKVWGMIYGMKCSPKMKHTHNQLTRSHKNDAGDWSLPCYESSLLLGDDNSANFSSCLSMFGNRAFLIMELNCSTSHSKHCSMVTLNILSNYIST
jgi:hypothetical protein